MKTKTKTKIENKGEGDDGQLMRDRHGFPVTRQGLIISIINVGCDMT